MLIIGAKGHAKEILGVLQLNSKDENLYFYDDISADLPELLYNKYQIVKSLQDATSKFDIDNKFILGIGGCNARAILFNKFISIGGKPYSIIAKNASIGSEQVNLEEGINIMQFAFISNNVSIGKGTLINARANIHHDVKIGDFCEICPSTTITGGVVIGNNSFVGSGSIILPKIHIGNNVIIGAGSVVTKDIPDNVLVYGNPARIKKQ